jgi:hypothetical protein
MSYTYKALTLVWLIVFGLAALSGSGIIAGSWVLLLVAAALVMPALTLTLLPKPRGSVGAVTTSQGRGLGVSDMRDRSPRDVSGIDVENDDGTRRTHFSGGVPEPVPVVQ